MLENRISFLNLTPRLREVAEQTSSPLYYEDGGRAPTPAGYRLIAEEVAHFLVARGVNWFKGLRSGNLTGYKLN